jgi:hypothetical protein
MLTSSANFMVLPKEVIRDSGRADSRFGHYQIV